MEFAAGAGSSPAAGARQGLCGAAQPETATMQTLFTIGMQGRQDQLRQVTQLIRYAGPICRPQALETGAADQETRPDVPVFGTTGPIFSTAGPILRA
jgi:hypothetical protein